MADTTRFQDIWIIDDDTAIRWVLEKALQRENLRSRSFETGTAALDALNNGQVPRLMISDIRMPGTSGLELLQHVKKEYADLPVIVMTAFSDLDSAVSAFQGGAFEYLPKPFDVDQAVALVKRALLQTTTQPQTEEATLAPEILGQASAMQEVFRAIGRLSNSSATVLITGESGTGKELVAQALHRHSPRAQAAFVAINTAAIPRDLLESELFGHEKGAFTGAATQRTGRFEQARGGTLFLDEIGDMPPELQTRLLRVLSDGHFYRVGGQHPLRADVRIIAATHQDLEARVRQGQFRADLFHRLNVIRIRLPSLRERSEDIPLLCRHFLAKSAHALGVEGKQLAPDTQERLCRFDFPGNVRQLENLCHWLTVMAPGNRVELADLPPEFTAPTPVTPNVAAADLATHDWLYNLQRVVDALLQTHAGTVYERLIQDFERILIRRALVATGGRRIEAANLLGIGRNTLTRKAQELGMDTPGE